MEGLTLYIGQESESTRVKVWRVGFLAHRR
jgi:hypothetical protein